MKVSESRGYPLRTKATRPAAPGDAATLRFRTALVPQSNQPAPGRATIGPCGSPWAFRRAGREYEQPKGAAGAGDGEGRPPSHEDRALDPLTASPACQARRRAWF